MTMIPTPIMDNKRPRPKKSMKISNFTRKPKPTPIKLSQKLEVNMLPVSKTPKEKAPVFFIDENDLYRSVLLKNTLKIVSPAMDSGFKMTVASSFSDAVP